MNYQRVYDNLIRTRKERVCEDSVYYEKHHILPRSLGGNNGTDNLVKLTAREHFLAHWLLWRIYQEDPDPKRRQSMAFAFHAMKRKTQKQKRELFSKIAWKEANDAMLLLNAEIQKKGTETRKRRYEEIKNDPVKWEAYLKFKAERYMNRISQPAYLQKKEKSAVIAAEKKELWKKRKRLETLKRLILKWEEKSKLSANKYLKKRRELKVEILRSQLESISNQNE